MRTNLYALWCVVGLGAAACLAPRVIVMPSGPGVVGRSKQPSCHIDFFRTRIERPYEEIAALSASGGDTFKNGPGDFQEALRRKACDLGADAVIVTREFTGVGGAMSGTAVRYRDARQ